MKLYVGVDGGGTTARVAVIDEQRQLVASCQGPTANPHSTLDPADAMANLAAVVSEAIASAGGGPVERAVFALAGVSTRLDAEAITARIRRSPLGALTPDFQVTNDTVAALWSAQCALPAIVLVAGTGSHCLGVSATSTARALGLEYVLTDDGGAFDIGLRALRAVIRAADGRGRATRLSHMIAETLRIQNVSELYHLVHSGTSLKLTVSSLAPLADEAALAGDRVAKAILLHAARSLSDAIRAVVERLQIAATPASLILVGSVLRESSLVREHVVAATVRRYPLMIPLQVQTDASRGAALLALDEAQIDVWSPYERPIVNDDPGPISDDGGK
jgi:N-acetylglucosamine kinase-like BadF-type ATPase